MPSTARRSRSPKDRSPRSSSRTAQASRRYVTNILSGAMTCDHRGREFIGETEVTDWQLQDGAAGGIAHVLALASGGLTVLENLMVAPTHQAGESFVNVLFRPALIKRQEREHAERALRRVDTACTGFGTTGRGSCRRQEGSSRSRAPS